MDRLLSNDAQLNPSSPESQNNFVSIANLWQQLDGDDKTIEQYALLQHVRQLNATVSLANPSVAAIKQQYIVAYNQLDSGSSLQ